MARKKKKAEETAQAEEQVNQNPEMEEGKVDMEAQVEEHDEAISEADEWKAKYQELNDRYTRLYSDFENFRKRTARERSDLIMNASEDVILTVIPVLDDLDRAIENNQNSEDIESIKEGFKLIHDKLFRLLQGKGLKPMDSHGTDFDSEHMEAVTRMPAQDDKEKGKVVAVVEKGYYLHDKILRYAKVVVGE